jgi:hypothetical protein
MIAGLCGLFSRPGRLLVYACSGNSSGNLTLKFSPVDGVTVAAEPEHVVSSPEGRVLSRAGCNSSASHVKSANAGPLRRMPQSAEGCRPIRLPVIVLVRARCSCGEAVRNLAATWGRASWIADPERGGSWKPFVVAGGR